MQVATRYLKNMSIQHKVITSPYSPALQDVWMMERLFDMNIPPLDWIIVADIDEFYTYGYQNLKDVTSSMLEDKSTYAIGTTVDHISLTGALTEVKVWLKNE